MEDQPVYNIDPRFIIDFRGKPYPLYQGVLDAATKAGLSSLRTTVVQIPHPDNGHMAVVVVRAEFADGRVFEAVGDASPANCSAQIATAALRMAETRGGGRAMRVAINCGMTLLEELPDEETKQARPAASNQPARVSPAAPGRTEAPRTNGSQNPPRAPAPAGDGAAAHCSWDGCGQALTKNQRTISQHKVKLDLCPVHLKEMEQSAK